MTGDGSGTDEDDRLRKPSEEGLHRLLIEQFYEDAVARYGPDSEQARRLSRYLHTGEAR